MSDVPRMEGEESPLERVRRRLYTNNPQAPVASSAIDTSAPEAARGWAKEQTNTGRKLPLSALFLIIATGFFLIAGIAAALILFMGGRSISSDRMEISFEETPTAVNGGEIVSFVVEVKNQNPSLASAVSFSIDFPEGTYQADAPTVPLTHYDVELADIPAGGSMQESMQVIFYGPEGSVLSVPVRVSYRTENSSAVFEKDAEHRITITSSPISVSVTALDEVASGQPLTLVASVRSNAPSNLENVGVAFTAPFGFALIDASPNPVNSVFSLGAMRPGDEREIRITGTLTGQDGDEPVFIFSAGVLPSADARALSKPAYTTAEVPIRITKSFLGVALSLNGSQEDTIAIPAGEDVQAGLSWTNTLTSSIADGKITVALSGDAFDPTSVSAANGFYRSSDRTVTFTRDTEAGLENLAPGDTGNGSFRFTLKDAKELEKLRNPSVTLTVSVAGRRVGNVSENLSATLTRTVRVAAGLTLSADIVRALGTFENSGPIPPEPDQETTYTVRLTSGTSLNTMANAKVSMKLPQNVRFTGIASAGDSVSFDAGTRTLTWSIGELVAGTTQDAAFQIGFTPTASQSGDVPVLVEGITASGFDRFTQSQVSATTDPLTTETRNDAAFQSGDERVQ